ncbi:FaeA/PapI family transcriptional regulator [Erwinia sorbitola]|uniref:FaeA-like family protein n=1 Tax=Erwinia sorbitola TaxID=2681984 RepID=A0A6I6ETG3_9GAMM|nr:hypothetical protein GN242_21300 [Erwinia sorbitola]
MRRTKLVVQEKKQEVLRTLNLLCGGMNESREKGRGFSNPETWPKTRELADSCGETIYMTRNILLQLVNEGKVIKHSSPLLNSLRWYANKNDGI